MNVQNLLECVVREVISAGELLAAEWHRAGGARGHGDKADIDYEIEVFLRSKLLHILDCDFWGEEAGTRMTGHEFCWVVDPNDGTADFLKGRAGSAISVGLLRNALPVLGVVHAPVSPDRGADCIYWAEGLPAVVRNGLTIPGKLAELTLKVGTGVYVSTAAASKPELNMELCAPASFIPMPSIAYRLARVAAGDAVAATSLVPVSAHDVVGGHALLLGAAGVLLNQDGEPVSYGTEERMREVSLRCFGGAPEACRALVTRDWGSLLR